MIQGQEHSQTNSHQTRLFNILCLMLAMRIPFSFFFFFFWTSCWPVHAACVGLVLVLCFPLQATPAD
ncbi:hypothetical protein BJ741DRAFT_633422, partial [Chytriomyces cf. hyalinus JEL632]